MPFLFSEKEKSGVSKEEKRPGVAKEKAPAWSQRKNTIT